MNFFLLIVFFNFSQGYSKNSPKEYLDGIFRDENIYEKPTQKVTPEEILDRLKKQISKKLNKYEVVIFNSVFFF